MQRAGEPERWAMNSLEDLYRDLRPYAFAIAYRMLGSVSEAEDVVQDAFVRMSQVAAEEIQSPKSYLATVTTRLAIDALRSARVQRETYLGPWLPEPLMTEQTPGPDVSAEISDSLSMAFLVVLETLRPVERAAFLLHDVFSYDYSEIAPIVGKSEANCRQLVSRARRHLEAGRPRFDASGERSVRLAERFFAACQGVDVDGLVDLLAGDVVFYGDGGRKGAGVRFPVLGRDNVVKLLVNLFRRGGDLGIRLVPVEVNGQPGAKVLDPDGGLINVLSLDIADGVVQTVRSCVNPDKLRHLGKLSPIGRRAAD
jgi:RNA polymerase sigma-70 factor (ECF subfamily)